MRIRQLGNGGGFDFNQTSSSFLIDIKEETYVLFDCGHNVMNNLLKIQKEEDKDIFNKIKYVFISHLHDDHISNLGAFLLYRKYILNLDPLDIFCHPAVHTDLINYIKIQTQHTYEGGRVLIDNSILNHCHQLVTDGNGLFYIGKNGNDNIRIFASFETYHPGIKSGGLIILTHDSIDSSLVQGVIITGDTKAISELETHIIPFNVDKTKENLAYFEKIEMVIFHDYSKWNAPSRNVHACDGDINVEYSENFRNILNYYHTGESFDSNWKSITDFEKKLIIGNDHV